MSPCISMLAPSVLTRLTVAFVLVAALTNADCHGIDLCDTASLVTLKKNLPVRILSGPDVASMNVVQSQPVNAMVFYHVFVNDSQDMERVRSIVHNQTELIPATLLPEIAEIRISSIGAPLNISDLNLRPELQERTTISAHYAEGWEFLTLHDLWSFCREKDTNPNQIVVYLHSKGSMSLRDQEIKWRQNVYLTTGALSEECVHMPNYCNICSTRMSPLPYSQTPGNMWAARCGYVAQLKDPQFFQEDMLQVQDGKEKKYAICIGTDRFAAEHWVYSHPAAVPCDLDASVHYTNSLQIALRPPKAPYTRELKKAPRFELAAYHWYRRDACQGWGETLSRRLAEYRVLYGTEPGADWWGWIFFKRSFNAQ